MITTEKYNQNTYKKAVEHMQSLGSAANKTALAHANLMIATGQMPQFPENDFGLILEFTNTFLTKEMCLTFSSYVDAFLENEPMLNTVLPDSNYTENGDFVNLVFPKPTDNSFQQYIYQMYLGRILICAMLGSDVSREILRSLYKKHYSREYKILKRFHSLNIEGLLDIYDDMHAVLKKTDPIWDITKYPTVYDRELALWKQSPGHMHAIPRLIRDVFTEKLYISNDPIGVFGETTINNWKYQPNEPSLPTFMARIHVMCKMFDIPIDDTCNALFIHSNNEAIRCRKIGDEPVFAPRDYSREIKDCKNFFPEFKSLKYQEMEKYGQLQVAQDIVMSTAQQYGLPADMFYATEPFDIAHEYIEATRWLDAYGLNPDICSSTVLYAVMLNYITKASAKMYKESIAEIQRLLRHKTIPEARIVEKIVEVEKEDPEDITLLKEQLEKIKTENRNLRAIINEKQDTEKLLRNKLSDLDILKDENDRLKAVLSASEQTEHVSDQVSIENMAADIACKKIVLIGGHERWIKKVKDRFPDWKYISSNSESFHADSADMAYFFTDYLNHPLYYKYISFLSKNNIPYSFLANINLEMVIRQIYYKTR